MLPRPATPNTDRITHRVPSRSPPGRRCGIGIQRPRSPARWIVRRFGLVFKKCSNSVPHIGCHGMNPKSAGMFCFGLDQPLFFHATPCNIWNPLSPRGGTSLRSPSLCSAVCVVWIDCASCCEVSCQANTPGIHSIPGPPHCLLLLSCRLFSRGTHPLDRRTHTPGTRWSPVGGI